MGKKNIPFPTLLGTLAQREQWALNVKYEVWKQCVKVSSFGLSMRKVYRLLPPIGDCVPTTEPLPSWCVTIWIQAALSIFRYIFRNYKYEPEACFKSCYQSRIIQRCGCADPRYPTARNETKLCDSLEVFSSKCTQRQYLRNLKGTCLLRESKRFTRNEICRCKHPW